MSQVLLVKKESPLECARRLEWLQVSTCWAGLALPLLRSKGASCWPVNYVTILLMIPPSCEEVTISSSHIFFPLFSSRLIAHTLFFLLIFTKTQAPYKRCHTLPFRTRPPCSITCVHLLFLLDAAGYPLSALRFISH